MSPVVMTTIGLLQDTALDLADIHELSDDKLSDEDYYVRKTCRRNVLAFLQEVKGMSESEARQYIQDHLHIECEFINLEEAGNPSCARTVRVSVTFKSSVE
jgi:hypothetical protein